MCDAIEKLVEECFRVIFQIVCNFAPKASAELDLSANTLASLLIAQS